MLFIPLVMLGIMFVTGVDPNVMMGILIPASAPTAGSLIMLAMLHDSDSVMASKLISLSTLLCIITIPLIMSLYFHIT